MIIAADIRSFPVNLKTNSLQKILQQLATAHPEHEFVFFADKYSPNLSAFSNIRYVQINPAANKLLFKLWYDFKLPALLKKYQADLFVGSGYISSSEKILQILVFPTTEIIPQTNFKYFKKWLPLFRKLKKNALLVRSHTERRKLIDLYKIAEAKISVMYPLTRFHQLRMEWEMKERIKEKYTGGKEYFLYSGDIAAADEKLINLLKAFSFFKKRQKSNMQLIIASPAVSKSSSFVQNFASYKYREEVKLLYDLPAIELEAILAAAYAGISLSTDFAIQVLACSTALIAEDTPVMNELFGEAALYATFQSFEPIAQQLMLVFKDEQKRNDIIRQGEDASVKFQLENAADSLWQTIVKTTG